MPNEKLQSTEIFASCFGVPAFLSDVYIRLTSINQSTITYIIISVYKLNKRQEISSCLRLLSVVACGLDSDFGFCCPWSKNMTENLNFKNADPNPGNEDGTAACLLKILLEQVKKYQIQSCSLPIFLSLCFFCRIRLTILPRFRINNSKNENQSQTSIAFIRFFLYLDSRVKKKWVRVQTSKRIHIF